MVNRLVGIPDSENVSILSGECSKDLDLGEVRILKLIHQDEAGLAPLDSEQIRIAFQERVSTGDHVAEGAKVVFEQPALGGRKHAGNLLATAKDLRIAQLTFRFGDARDGQFASFQLLNICGVALGRHQLVVAAAEKLQKIL